MNRVQRSIVYIAIVAIVLAFLWATVPDNSPQPQGIFLPATKTLPASVPENTVKFIKDPVVLTKFLGTVSLMQRYTRLSPQLEANLRQAILQLAAKNGSTRVHIEYFVSNPGQPMAAYWLQARAYE